MLRVCETLLLNCDRFVTVAQLASVGVLRLVTSLCQRREYYVAKKVVEWIGLKNDVGRVSASPASDETAQKILGTGNLYEKSQDAICFSWVQEKIRNNPALTDAQLCQSVVDNFTSSIVRGS